MAKPFLHVAPLLLVVTALSLYVTVTNACTTPKAGCKNCTNLVYAYYLGVGKDTSKGSLNLERFTKLAGSILKSVTTIKTFADCCRECAATSQCTHWHFFNVSTGCPGVASPGCYLLKNRNSVATANSNSAYPWSWVGGACNPNANVTADPHFVGGHGTRFDFNGELGRPFCLLTDRRLHVNIVLDGYLDERTSGATLLSTGKAIRSWIRKLVLMWKDAEGQKHEVSLKARDSTQQDRGHGFIEEMRLDGDSVAVPEQVGEELTFAGGFHMRVVDKTKRGHQDMDLYNVVIDGVADFDVSLRVAHPLLQTRDNAFAHFSLRVNYVEASPEVHGVLGQTFRNDEDRVMRAVEYKTLASLLRSPVQADGATGKGFLDGDIKDYITSSAAAADCKFATAWNL